MKNNISLYSSDEKTRPTNFKKHLQQNNKVMYTEENLCDTSCTFLLLSVK